MQRCLALFGLTILALAGSVLLYLSFRWGIGLSPDSVTYIAAARNFLAGRGLSFPAGGEVYDPMTAFPPLFSLLLSLPGIFGLDPRHGAALINAFLYGANAFLAGKVICKLTSSGILAAWGTFLFLANSSILLIHSMAWSEPLLIFTGFAGLFFLIRYLETQDKRFLRVSAAAVALACVTKYSGAGFLAAAILSLALLQSKSRAERLKDVSFYTAVGLLPAALWILRNSLVGTAARGESIGFHPPPFAHYRFALSSFSLWLLPEGIAPAFRGIALAAAAGLVIVAITRTAKSSLFPSRFLSIFGFFAVSYLAIYFTNFTFFATDPLDPRASSVLFPVFLFILLTVVSFLLKASSLPQAVRCGTAGFLVIWTAAGVVGALGEWGENRSGRGFAGLAWRNSEIIREVKEIPSETPIYTNASDALYILTGKSAYTVPGKRSGLLTHVSEPIRENYFAQIDELKDKITAGGGVIVFFDRLEWRKFYGTSAEELRTRMPIKLLKKVSDGAIYGLE